MSPKPFKFESVQSRESVTQYLDSLIQGIESGKIKIGDKTDSVDLKVDGLINFTVRAKHKNKRNKLQIQIQWK